MKDKPTKIELKDYGQIKSTFNEIADLIDLIPSNISNKLLQCLIERLILSMKELNYYADKYFKKNINTEIQKSFEDIIKARNAIGHRYSDNNRLDNGIVILGGKLIRENDIEVQYGETILSLMATIKLYENIRKMFYDESPENENRIWGNPYGLAIEEKKLEDNKVKILESIKILYLKLTTSAS